MTRTQLAEKAGISSEIIRELSNAAAQVGKTSGLITRDDIIMKATQEAKDEAEYVERKVRQRLLMRITT
ncbi:MAG: hypothetical protein Q7R95_07275 [bacterium]|nr:hypothetical protein [bacterium]